MGKFKKGQSGNAGGRPKGTPNKTTQTVKEAVVNAFEKLGGSDYLVKIAKTEPKAFISLLGRVIPTELTGSVEGLIVKLVNYNDEERNNDTKSVGGS